MVRGGPSRTSSRKPLIMGILNVTPDSFSDGGAFFDPENAVRRALEMVEHGADIVDIGGESTRPGSNPVSADEEWKRVAPVLEALAGLPVPISIDTRRAAVARRGLEAGCRMVNDVSAGGDPAMAETVSEFDVPVVLMHMKGEPRTMQENPTYEDVVGEVRAFLASRANLFDRQGVKPDRIIIDPGIGFGKRVRDNLDILCHIDAFKELGFRVLVGASRKSFLGQILGTSADDRVGGSLAVAARCYEHGVDMVRVHDVKETAGLFKVLDAMDRPGGDEFP
jgi:dihydropteroate synthase